MSELTKVLRKMKEGRRIPRLGIVSHGGSNPILESKAMKKMTNEQNLVPKSKAHLFQIS